MDLCTKCGVNPRYKNNGHWCKPCITACRHARVEKRIAAGLCTHCGGTKEDSSKRRCRRCLDRLPSICTNCGVNPASKNTSWCKSCNARRTTDARHKRIAEGVCSHCGNQKEQPSKKMCNYCLAKHTERTRETFRALKKQAVDYLGGQCVECGFRTICIEVYDFHHLDPLEKGTEISKLRSWPKIVEELRKCILLCSNCHRIREAYERQEEAA